MDNNTQHIYASLVRLAIVIGVMLAAMAISSCTTTRTIEVPVVSERVTHDTLYKYRGTHTTDTIYRHDSIVVRTDGTDRYTNTRRTHTERTTDTIYLSHTDTIPKYIRVTKTVYKEKPLQWWQTAVMSLGYMVASAIIAAVAVAIKKGANHLFKLYR